MDLVGSYPVKLDKKGRMRLPSRLIDKLGEVSPNSKFYVARGVGKCLSLYTQEAWDNETHKFKKLDLDQVTNLIMVRNFYHFATESKLDSADRLTLTSMQMEAAEINDEVVVYTFLDRIEIWSLENYKTKEIFEIDHFGQMREQAFAKPKSTLHE